MLNTIKIRDCLFAVLLSCFAYSSNTYATQNEIEEPNISELLYQGRFDVLEGLIDDGKNIDLKTLPLTLFDELITLNNWPGVIWLLDHGLSFDDIGFEQNFTILFKQAHCLENLQWLIDQGADIDIQNGGDLLISEFLRKGYAEAALVLINNGADFELLKCSQFFIPLNTFPRKSRTTFRTKNSIYDLRLWLLRKPKGTPSKVDPLRQELL